MNQKRTKTDRRVIRTRKNLYKALMELLLEKKYTSITVQEIAERANVGRATFYLHYNHKNDLLIKNLEIIFEGLADRIKPLLEEMLVSGEANPNKLIFEEARKNEKLYYMILSGSGGRVLYDEFFNSVLKVIQNIFQEQFGDQINPRLLEIMSHGLAGNVLSLLTWWLGNDMPCSEEEIADIYTKLTRPGIRNLLLGDASN